MNDLRTESERHLKHMCELLGDRFNELSFMVNNCYQETSLTSLKDVNLNLEKLAIEYLKLTTCDEQYKFLFNSLFSFPSQKFSEALSYIEAVQSKITKQLVKTIKDSGVKKIILYKPKTKTYE